MWWHVLKVMVAAVDAGFMFNLRKCKFCTTSAVVLGQELLKYGYRVSHKFLASWVGLAVPRTRV